MSPKNKFKMRTTPQTFEDAYRLFILEKRAKGLSESTLETYVYDFRTMCRFIPPHTPISGIRTEDIQEVFAEMAASSLSRNSIRHYTASFKSFLSYCNTEGICDAQIALFKGEESVPQTYSQEELKRLLKAPNLKQCEFAEFRNYVIVNLLINDGCRAGTIRAIQNRDVHLAEGVIYLRHMKKRKTIAIPLCDSIITILHKYMEIRRGRPDECLFCNEDGTAMTEAGLRSAIRRYNKKRGVELCSLHAFRHTFARMYLIDCNGDALKLQKLLGHETLDMTRHYIKMYDADIVSDRNRSPLEILQNNRIKMR